MANIAEGFSRKGDKEFAQFLFVAKSSAAELQSHGYVALDQGYINDADFKGLYEALDHVSRMLSNLIKRLSHPHRNHRNDAINAIDAIDAMMQSTPRT